MCSCFSVSDCSVVLTVVALKAANVRPEEQPVEGGQVAIGVLPEYNDVLKATDNPMSGSLDAGLLPTL